MSSVLFIFSAPCCTLYFVCSCVCACVKIHLETRILMCISRHTRLVDLCTVCEQRSCYAALVFIINVIRCALLSQVLGVTLYCFFNNCLTVKNDFMAFNERRKIKPHTEEIIVIIMLFPEPFRISYRKN